MKMKGYATAQGIQGIVVIFTLSDILELSSTRSLQNIKDILREKARPLVGAEYRDRQVVISLDDDMAEVSLVFVNDELTWFLPPLI